MNDQLQPNEYRCALCGTLYEKGWTDKEAMAETHAYWPGTPQEACGVVCDDCWQMVKPCWPPTLPMEPVPLDIAFLKHVKRMDEIVLSAFALTPEEIGIIQDVNTRDTRKRESDEIR